MSRVRRWDRGELKKPEKTSGGMVRCEGFLTRTGVFVYKTSDGGEVREYRPPEEVFHPEALASFNMVPLTNLHPASGMVDADNARAVAVGAVGEPVQDGQFVRAPLMVMDAKAIADMYKGRAELSCGYTCELEWKTGFVNGERYDAIQRNIRGNHVALVDRGRAGKDARVRLDGGDAIQGDPPPEVTMKKVKLDGQEIEVSDDAAAAIEKFQGAQDATVLALKQKADAAEARADKAEKALAEANDPKTLRARIDGRVKLERQALAVLGEAKLDGLTDREVQDAVLVKLGHDKAKLATKGDAWVDGAFETVIEEQAKKNPALAELVKVVDAAHRNAPETGGGNGIVEAAAAKHAQEMRNLYKAPNGAAK